MIFVYPEEPADVWAREAAPLAPPLNVNFTGVIDDGCWIPPDTMGAVGPNDFVEMLNSGFTVAARPFAAWGAQQNLGFQPANQCPTATRFCQALGLGQGQPANDVFDPKVMYDQYSNRWVVTADGNANDRAGGGKTWVLVGISQTSNPLGAWNLYGIQSNTNDGIFNHNVPGDWSDYPGLAVDPNNVVITNNMYGICNTNVNPCTGNCAGVFPNCYSPFVHADVWVIDKQAMINGNSLVQGPPGGNFARFHNPGVFPGGSTFQPTHTFGQTAGTAKTYLVDQGWSVAGSINRYVRMHEISGTGSAATLTETGWYQVNSYNHCIDDAPQPGSGPPTFSCPPIETNDPRMLDAVFRNGKVWATHHVGAGTSQWYSCTTITPTRTEVAWYEFDPTKAGPWGNVGTPDQQGRAFDNSDPPMYYYFPSIAVNKYNAAALGFTGSSLLHPTGYASAYYTARTPTDAGRGPVAPEC